MMLFGLKRLNKNDEPGTQNTVAWATSLSADAVQTVNGYFCHPYCECTKPCKSIKLKWTPLWSRSEDMDAMAGSKRLLGTPVRSLMMMMIMFAFKLAVYFAKYNPSSVDEGPCRKTNSSVRAARHRFRKWHCR